MDRPEYTGGPFRPDPADPPVSTQLPFCGECHGTVHHATSCSAYDPARQIVASGGLCLPEETP